jgi:hypothetical protein
MLYQMIYDLICIAVENLSGRIHGLMRPPPLTFIAYETFLVCSIFSLRKTIFM